ncbi:MAG: hypothetical protein ACE5GD_04415 [Candidatus Geothermarchaeales archaeon]
MVEIVIEPWKKIIIHEVIEYRLEDFLRVHTVEVPPGGKAPPVPWTNGIVFDRTTLPDVGAALEEKIKGILHYSSVTYALKPNFEQEIVDKDRNITIPLIDVSNNEIFIQLTDLLKKQSKVR